MRIENVESFFHIEGNWGVIIDGTGLFTFDEKL